MTRDEYDDADLWVCMNIPRDIELPPFSELQRGGIVGAVDITGCCSMNPSSSWFTGPFGFMLANPESLSFRPCRGALGFFTPEGL